MSALANWVGLLQNGQQRNITTLLVAEETDLLKPQNGESETRDWIEEATGLPARKESKHHHLLFKERFTEIIPPLQISA